MVFFSDFTGDMLAITSNGQPCNCHWEQPRACSSLAGEDRRGDASPALSVAPLSLELLLVGGCEATHWEHLRIGTQPYQQKQEGWHSWHSLARERRRWKWKAPPPFTYKVLCQQPWKEGQNHPSPQSNMSGHGFHSSGPLGSGFGGGGAEWLKCWSNSLWCCLFHGSMCCWHSTVFVTESKNHNLLLFLYIFPILQMSLTHQKISTSLKRGTEVLDCHGMLEAITTAHLMVWTWRGLVPLPCFYKVSTCKWSTWE